MTLEQEVKLRELCERYKVHFRAEDYTPRFDLPDGWVAGWIGGYEPEHARQMTLFVGVSPTGEAAS